MTTRPQLLFAIPAALGAVVALGLGAAVLWPQWQQVQLSRSRVAELQALEAQLPLLAGQLQREQEGVGRAQGQQAQVLELIAGSGSLATFLAQLDQLAAASGVKLGLFEPLATAAPPPDPKATAKPAAKDKNAPPPPPADPLLGEGVAKQEVLVSATGSYPALLAFMRRLEALNVLVAQSNLQLAAEPIPVQLKMGVATYYRAAP